MLLSDPIECLNVWCGAVVFFCRLNIDKLKFFCVQLNAEEEERSRIDPLKEDLCMLRGLFLDALRKGSSEVQVLRAEPGHLVFHSYDTKDLDYKKASTNLDGIEQITDGVKSILRLSDVYAGDASSNNLKAICEVTPGRFPRRTLDIRQRSKHERRWSTPFPWRT